MFLADVLGYRQGVYKKKCVKFDLSKFKAKLNWCLNLFLSGFTQNSNLTNRHCIPFGSHHHNSPEVSSWLEMENMSNVSICSFQRTGSSTLVSSCQPIKRLVTWRHVVMQCCVFWCRYGMDDGTWPRKQWSKYWVHAANGTQSGAGFS